MKRFLAVVVGVSFTMVLILCASLFFAVQKWAEEIPPTNTLKNYHHELATVVFSEDGQKIGEFTTERRYPIEFNRIPRHVIQAFLAAEDAKFYEHQGVDFAGITRAFLSNVLKARFAQGGSTITQQVAKTLLLTRKKEISRKVKEVILAFRIEKELSKDEILSLYLNEIYLGHGAFGIEAACQNYFGKSVTEIDVAEAALVAGLPQRPNDWDPFKNPGIAKKRQVYVLTRMAEEKFISSDQAKEALNKTIRLKTLENLTEEAAPYFTEYVRQYLMNKYGSESILKEGYRVFTTVNYKYQKIAEKALSNGLREVDKRLGWRGVTARLSEKEFETKQQQLHERVLKEITPYRLLPPQIDLQTKDLSIDLSFLDDRNRSFFGATPVQEGNYYEGVVLKVAEDGQYAIAKIGFTQVELPFSTAQWVKVNEQPVTGFHQFLKPNDVIQVKVEKIDRLKNRVIAALEQDPEIQGAFLSYDLKTGNVVAMVGGRDFKESKFNRALQAKRQVGSTFKPLLYAAALDKGFSPSSLVTDAPLVFKNQEKLDADNQGEDWRPKNYSGTYEGDIPLRLALIRSMNIPTVKLLSEVSLDYAIKYARSLGITSNLPSDLSIALGSWSSSLEEVSRAYAVFPRLGKTLGLNYILKIVDASGKVVEEAKTEERLPSSSKKNLIPLEEDEKLKLSGLVITPQTAYVMVDMLKGVVREGTGRPAFIPGLPMAGKTGTSNDHKDAWFIGFTPQLMSGVWIGYDKDVPLDPQETGGKAAAPVWSSYMGEVSKFLSKEDFEIPEDVVFAYIDRETGKLSDKRNPKRVRVAFKVGTVPNREGSNLLTIGEPTGTTYRHMSGSESDTDGADEAPKASTRDSDNSELLRDGY